MNNSNTSTQMRKGIIEFSVLLLLSRGRIYPTEVIQMLEEAGLSLKEATVYTVLNRLKKEEKVSYEWVESVKGPPRKYFRITPQGMEALKEASESWQQIEYTINYLRNKYRHNTNETDH